MWSADIEDRKRAEEKLQAGERRSPAKKKSTKTSMFEEIVGLSCFANPCSRASPK